MAHSQPPRESLNSTQSLRATDPLRASSTASAKHQDLDCCPCRQHSDDLRSYADCCEPPHQGQAAASAEALMRSRFSAFALGLGDYLWRSHHSSTRQTFQQGEEQWLKLEIHKTHASQVEFTAYYSDQDKLYALRELSNFLFENGHCYYLDGHHKPCSPDWPRNAPCWCGSGKKTKQCHR